MKHEEKVDKIISLSMRLAPSLRDKFDFSSDVQFTDWAKLAYKAALAFDSVFESEYQSAIKLDETELDKYTTDSKPATKEAKK